MTSIKYESERLIAIKIIAGTRAFLVFSVYMSTESIDNLNEFAECLTEINAVIENSGIAVYVLGDFNAQPRSLFGT